MTERFSPVVTKHRRLCQLFYFHEQLCQRNIYINMLLESSYDQCHYAAQGFPLAGLCTSQYFSCLIQCVVALHLKSWLFGPLLTHYLYHSGRRLPPTQLSKGLCFSLELFPDFPVTKVFDLMLHD